MRDFNTYQTRAHETAYVYEEGVDAAVALMAADKTNRLGRLIYVALGVAGEAGEFAGKIQKIIRDAGGEISDEAYNGLISEAGDIAWHLAESCTVLGVHMDDMVAANLAKLKMRRLAGTIKGSGDNR